MRSVTCLVAILMACSDSDERGGDTDAASDANTETGPPTDSVDAADVDAADVDAADADADTDADTTDADTTDAPAPTTITVEVIARDVEGLPVDGTTLIAHASDGALVGTFTTDALGRATLTLPPGAMLTSFGSLGERAGAFTVMGLADGDVVSVAAGTAYRLLSHAPQPDAVFPVTIPGTFPDADTYLALTTCGRGNAAPNASEVFIDYAASCLAGRTTLDVAAWPTTSSGFPLAFAWAEDAPIDGAPAALSSWTPLSALAVFSFRAEDAPLGAKVGGLSIATRHDGWETEVPHGLIAVPHFDAEGALGQRHDYLPEFADAIVTRFSVDLFVSDDFGRTFEYRRVDTEPPAAVTLSLAESRWAGGSDVGWDGSAIRWERVAAGADAAPDALVAAFTWQPAGPVPSVITWTIVAPPSTPSPLVLPVLPASHERFAWNDDDQAILADLTVWSSEASEGFAAYKTQYGSRVDTPDIDDARARVTVRRRLQPVQP